MSNQSGFAIMWVVVIAVILIGGGAVAYVATDGFGTNKDEAKVSNSSKDDSDSSDSSDSKADELPDWFHENFPIYPGSEVSTVSGGSGVHQTYIIAYEVDEADGAKVSEWYNQQYSVDGWEISDTGSETRFTAKKNGVTGYGAVVGISSTSLGTVVTITAADKLQ